METRLTHMDSILAHALLSLAGVAFAAGASKGWRTMLRRRLVTLVWGT